MSTVNKAMEEYQNHYVYWAEMVTQELFCQGYQAHEIEIRSYQEFPSKHEIWVFRKQIMSKAWMDIDLENESMTWNWETYFGKKKEL